MSNYPDGMGSTRILDARDINMDILCPNCGQTESQDLEQYRSKVYGYCSCHTCGHEWEIEIYN